MQVAARVPTRAFDVWKKNAREEKDGIQNYSFQKALKPNESMKLSAWTTRCLWWWIMFEGRMWISCQHSILGFPEFGPHVLPFGCWKMSAVSRRMNGTDQSTQVLIFQWDHYWCYRPSDNENSSAPEQTQTNRHKVAKEACGPTHGVETQGPAFWGGYVWMPKGKATLPQCYDPHKNSTIIPRRTGLTARLLWLRSNKTRAWNWTGCNPRVSM